MGQDEETKLNNIYQILIFAVLFMFGCQGRKSCRSIKYYMNYIKD